MFGRLLILVLGLLGGAGFGQGPEIVTQYEQRLGGAVDELQKVINRFDEDAARNDLTREQALQTYAASSEAFLNDRGRSMQVAIFRLQDIQRQIVEFGAASEIYKPILLVTRADQQLLQGVMDDYSLGLPVTTGGVIYSGLGLLFGGLLGGICRAPFRRKKQVTA